jgi:hypothetical protein
MFKELRYGATAGGLSLVQIGLPSAGDKRGMALPPIGMECLWLTTTD